MHKLALSSRATSSSRVELKNKSGKKEEPQTVSRNQGWHRFQIKIERKSFFEMPSAIEDDKPTLQMLSDM